MASLQIDLFDAINDKRIWVILRDNLPVKDLIHKLIQDLELPQDKYVLVNEENNLTLPEKSTLVEEKIIDQHPLRIERKGKVTPVPVVIPGKKKESSKSEDSTTTKDKTGKVTGKGKGKASAKKMPASEKKIPEVQEAYKAHPTVNKMQPANRPIRPWLHRPFRRPPFLRGIPNNLWNFFTPLILIIILIFIFIIIFFCRCTNNNQAPLAAMGDQDDGPADFGEPMEELPDEQAEPQEEMIDEEVMEIILPDLDKVYESLPDIESDFPGVCYAVFNTQQEPFDDLELREAFAHAIDREYISQNWTCDECHFREQQPNYTLNPEEFYTVKTGADFYDQWANDVLPEGYTAGKLPIVLYTPEGDEGLAELVAANWREYLGVEVELAGQEFETFINTLNSSNPPGVYVWCTYLDKNSSADMLLLVMADYYGDYIRWDPPAKYYQAVLEGYENNDEEAYLRAERMLVEEYVVVAPIFSYNVD